MMSKSKLRWLFMLFLANILLFLCNNILYMYLEGFTSRTNNDGCEFHETQTKLLRYMEKVAPKSTSKRTQNTQTAKNVTVRRTGERKMMDGRIGALWFLQPTQPSQEKSSPMKLQPAFKSAHPTSTEACREKYQRENYEQNAPHLKRKDFTKVGICVVIRNEGSGLAEWLNYHRVLGVTRVVLYDDFSTDEPEKILEPFIKTGLVSYKHLAKEHFQEQAGSVFLQFEIAKKCVEVFKQEQAITGVKWVANFDIDEFLTPKSWKPDQLLGDVFDEISHRSCVELDRVQYGSGYHLYPPEGLVVEKYAYRVPELYSHEYNRMPKIAVNMDHPHFNQVGPGVGIHHVDNTQCYTWFGSIEGLRLNHYAKTAGDMVHKISTHYTATDKFDVGFHHFILRDHNDVADDNTMPYVCAVKKELGML